MCRRGLAGHPSGTIRFNEHDIGQLHPMLQLFLRRGCQFPAGSRCSGNGIAAVFPQTEKLRVRLRPDSAGRLHDMGGGGHQHMPVLTDTVRSHGVHQCRFAAAAHKRYNVAFFRQKRKVIFNRHTNAYSFLTAAMAICSGVMGSS